MLRRMRARMRQSLVDSARSFRAVFRNPGLRRLELAFVGSISGEWAYGVALAVFAYESGGAAAVGLVSVIKWVPSALAAPFLAMLADRYRRERVLLGADLVRAAAMSCAAAVALSDGPAPAIYAIAGFVALASKTFRPAQAALLPTLARSPEELSAANVTSTAIESAGSFVGPAVGGLLLVATSPGWVFAATAATFVWSALNVSRIAVEPSEPASAQEARRGFALEAFAGFGALWHDRDARLIAALYSAQTLVAGALNVLVVVTAIELLGLGNQGVGWLNAAFGVGGLLGAAAAFVLVGRQRLAGDFGVGIVLWGVALALIGVFPTPAAALLLLGTIGVGNTLVDVAGVTLMQRAVDDRVLARVFGALESLLVGTLAVGAALAPVLIHAIGVRAALIAVGSVLPVLALVAWRRLRRIDVAAVVPTERIALLRSLPIFAPLAEPTLERLAANLEEARLPAGAAVFRQGEPGDRFYVVRAGALEVSVDGTPVSEVAAGGCFGEVALLRDVPRTATVTAKADAELLALARDVFIGAVTGHAPSVEAANAVIGAYRIGSLRAEVGAL
jgi:MFS family permease